MKAMLIRLLSSVLFALACTLPLRAESTTEARGVAEGVALLMVEQKGCHYCEDWHETIGPAYPKTDEGAYAPLHSVMISADPPDGVEYARPVLFTPTFLLLEDGEEIGRIEGHPGDDFFWGLLGMLLEEKTGFAKADDDGKQIN